MAIPQAVREVKRPKNTIVIGPSNGPYAVRERIGCRYVVDESGKRHRYPIDGAVIGHIVNYKYVPNTGMPNLIKTRVRSDSKNWGDVYLCDRENSDILDRLRKYYSEDDAQWIYCEAILRTCNRGVRDYELQDYYDESYLSEMYPKVGFSKDTVSDKTRLLGRQRNTFYSLMKAQIEELSDSDVIVVDGCLKEDGCDEIYLSEPSRKTKHTGTNQHTMMYAYSLEKLEPVAEKDFPGNMPDSRAILDFVQSLEISHCMLMADKGFTVEAIMEVVQKRNDLKYLIPIPRNRKIIDQYHLLDMDSVIIYKNQPISCRKVQLVDNNNNPLPIWLYAYCNPKIEKQEKDDYLLKHPEIIDVKEFEKAKKDFGLIVFQSNSDMDLKQIYDVYDGRWNIETLFRFHKSELDEDDSRMGSDASVVGSDFIDYLSTLMGIRLIKFFEQHKEFKSKTFKQAMHELRGCRKVRGEGGNWDFELMTKKRTKLLVKIGLMPKYEDPDFMPEINQDPFSLRVRNPVGRPKGKKDSKPRKRRTKAELGQ